MSKELMPQSVCVQVECLCELRTAMLKEWRGLATIHCCGVRQGKGTEGIAEVEVRELGSESGHGEPVPSLHPPEAPLLAEVEFGATQ